MPLIILEHLPDGSWDVGILREFGTAEGGTSNVQIERLQGTEDVTAGDDLLSSALDGNGTANTVQSGALVGTDVVNLNQGDRLAVYFSASTTVAEVAITILAEKA